MRQIRSDICTAGRDADAIVKDNVIVHAVIQYPGTVRAAQSAAHIDHTDHCISSNPSKIP